MLKFDESLEKSEIFFCWDFWNFEIFCEIFVRSIVHWLIFGVAHEHEGWQKNFEMLEFDEILDSSGI